MNSRKWLLLVWAIVIANCPAWCFSSVAAGMSASGCPDVRTVSAEFEITRSGYVQARLQQPSGPITLDDPGSRGGTSVGINGRVIDDFRLDCAHARKRDAIGKLGVSGKRIELIGNSTSSPDIEETIAFETYDDFPNVIFETVSWRNSGAANIGLKEPTVQRQRLSAAETASAVAPYDMWSFQGASEEWGKDDVVQVNNHFSRTNPMQQLTFTPRGAGGAGGGIPVIAFWTARAGEAIGQVDRLPFVLSMPVHTLRDGRVSAEILLSPNAPVLLHPGESYSGPTTFIAVFHGDYYEPLRLYSKMLEKQGWAPAHPGSADYQANWCSWGYRLQFTPAQIIGTIPKLQQLAMHWATLDAGWYDNRGDWNPRNDIGVNGIRSIVNAYHRAGLRITLWWIPLAAENGGKDVLDGSPYHVSSVVKEHPDWLILDQNGKPARMAGGFAALCPAIPEVRAYYKQLTERFVNDWGFDGNKLDFSYTVPACYNPTHHHASPQDSIRAVGDVYQLIFQTTRSLKPDSVTQVCPCGTTPNIAWLADFDQAVTADPVGSVQVRRRIKMYKALLGPQAAVYGDHVELTRILGLDSNETDLGRDFASTVGTGGVIGTKFTWPANHSEFPDVMLTPEKDALWNKWIKIYNRSMVSSGTFLNLYTYGYDSPEGYAIKKGNDMYYAFFRDKSQPSAEQLDLRGLGPGRFHAVDYETGKDYGTFQGPAPRLTTNFHDHLLLEVSKIEP